MAAVRNLRRNEKHKNYICALVAVNKTGEALESVTEHGLQTVHNQIQQNLRHLNLPQCVQQCSVNIHDRNRWCQTCSNWRIHLDNYILQGRRRFRVRWSEMKSWTWPMNSLNIAEVFSTDLNANNLKDLSTTLPIWKRCSVFQRQVVQAADHLRTSRNQLVHQYNAKMKITNVKKIEIFQNISNVITHPDIQPLIQNHNGLIQTIGHLEQGELFRYETDIMDALRDIGMQNADIYARLDRNALGLQEAQTKLENIALAMQKLTRHVFWLVVIAIMFVLCVLSSCGFFWYLNTPACVLLKDTGIRKDKHTTELLKPPYTLVSTEGCLVENLTYVNSGRVFLFEYVSHHKNFTGRNWLLNIIENKLLETTEEKHGLLLTAGMGYGKSALLKQIICSTKNSSANRLRSRLVAYHICRFDVTVSKKAYIFIFRMIAMFSTQMPVIGENMRACLDVFDRELCERDPNGCIDQCIIIPLKNVSLTGQEPVIIVVDGLDECYNTYRDENEIFVLLKYRIHRFPIWVKFLISSRQASELQKLGKYVRVLNLEEDDYNNMNDIKLYLQQTHMNFSQTEYAELIKSKVSNFLIASSLNEGFHFERGDPVPQSLDHYYDEQFRRHFKTTSDPGFGDAKLILEVICTSLKVLTEDELHYVILTSTGMPAETYKKAKMQLEMFIHNTGNGLYLRHISMQNWLLNSANEDFLINKANGHRLHALQIFRQIDKGDYNFDVVDLAIHVSYSFDVGLQYNFFNLSEPEIDSIQYEQYPLISLASRLDDYISADILAYHFRDVDHTDKNNVTALFIAASLGHLNTFEALLKRGANISFRSESFSRIINFDLAFQVSFEYKLWGYGVLDIAAQNGHHDLVDYIIANNGIMFDYPMTKLNSANLLPIHLACKRGHLKVVKLFHENYSFMLDWQCLYYGAAIGDIDLLKFIFKNDITDECRRCENYLHWIQEYKLRVQGQSIRVDSYKYEYVLFDDWNNITCESALHVAVRQNRLEVVKLLASQFKNAANCIDRGGRTPVIAALQYGYKDIVEYFASNGGLKGSEACGNVLYLKDVSKLHENELKRLQPYFCETGLPIVHIAAKFDHVWFGTMLKSYGLEANWNEKDRKGCFAIHQAACHNRLKMLTYLNEILNKNVNFLKCQNGSTPLHSAISCTAVSATEVLLLKQKKYLSESASMRTSLLMHAVSRNFGIELAVDTETTERNTAAIFSMLFIDETDLKYVDERGRNILHIAISKGHFYVVSYLYSKYPKLSETLHKEKEINAKRPVLYSIDKLETASNFHVYAELFFNYRAFHTRLNLMGAKEYAILLSLKFINQDFCNKKILERLVQKQCLHAAIHVLTKCNYDHLDGSSLSVVIENDRYGLLTLTYYSILLQKITNFSKGGIRSNLSRMIFICVTCEEIIHKCNLHKIALEYLKITKLLSSLNLDMMHNIVLKLLFQHHPSFLLSNCYDAMGFNVLERAIQGGCPHLVEQLLKAGVGSELEKDRLLYMALNSLDYRKEETYFAYSMATKADLIKLTFIKHSTFLTKFDLDRGYSKMSMDLDKTLLVRLLDSHFEYFAHRNRNLTDLLIYTLIKAYQTDLRKDQICFPRSRRLSLIHRFAFEGLRNTLALVFKLWGPNVLKCQNTDGFTPLYLYKVLHNKSEIHFLKEYDMSPVNPQKEAEMYFLFKLSVKFVFSGKERSQIKCLLTHFKTVPNNIYRLIKAYRCASKFYRISKTSNMKQNVNRMKWVLSFIIELDAWSKSFFAFTTVENIYLSNSILQRKFIQIMLAQDKFALVTKQFAFLTKILDVEGRMCGFLRKSFKKMILFRLEDIQSCPCVKNELPNILEEVLENIETYRWGTENCTDVYEMLKLCPHSGVDMVINTLLRNTLKSLSYELMHFAMKNIIYLPNSLDILSLFHRIENNLHVWLHMYKYYNYINELHKSQIYRESYKYRSKNVATFGQHVDSISHTVQFLQWQRNAEEILKSFLESKKT
ncbi:uncharacterized protein LOC123539460 [Mercenaria mercenaria]|uniref:uncharacterized protein LOC123539460 n=1 Tax=Mercenaria mercenaria TaxID=6596 RepID=UPI00234EFC67|nr:uncharacterized protein LOC123539460 [Mercenaria mercenaria]